MSKTVLGIDPGISGAFAITDNDVISIMDMPVKQIAGKKHVDGEAISRWLADHKMYIDVAVIEDVSSMPGDGVASAFKFGMRTGTVIGLLEAYNIKYIRVKPAVWKAGLGIGRAKGESLDLARRVFPHTEYFTRQKDDGRAEAALMAHYAIKELL